MNFARQERRAANKAAYAELRSVYDQLPRETRSRIVDDYKVEQGRGATISWSNYLAVILPLLPPDAR
jgi:hypothetical protein